jgi:hypothetical protein
MGCAAFVWRSARADVCPEVGGESTLSLGDIGRLKARFLQHARRPEAPLVLSDAEATFLLGAGLGWPVAVHAGQDRLTVDAQWNHAAGCSLIHVQGLATVVDGVAWGKPDALTVGDLDVGMMLAWRTWGWTLPEDPPVGAVRTLRVVDSQIEVWLADPVGLWEGFYGQSR